jgi:hypothetical protein
MAIYSEKYEKPIQATNISNFMITSNHNIKDTDGRRIIPLDISLEKKEKPRLFQES